MYKKVLFFFNFVIVISLFLTFKQPIRAITVQNNVTNIINSTINKLPLTFNDSNYQNPTTVFTEGSTVYLKFNSSADGSNQQEVWLLGSQKEKLQKINLEKSGNGPYIYEGKINLPYKNGLYYLSIKLQGRGNSFAFEQNIDVIAGNNTSAENKAVISGQEKQKPGLTPTIISPENKQEKGVKSILFNIIIKIINFLKSLF